MQTLKICPDCGGKITPLYPSPEEYLNTLFCINAFGYKLIFFKSHNEYGCIDCLIDKEATKERDKMEKVKENIYNDLIRDK